MIKQLLIAALTVTTIGCATLTEEPLTPIALSLSSGNNGSCKLDNKRGQWLAQVPTVVSVRRSDDALHYECKSDDGKISTGSIPSSMGGKIVASAVFLDLGITDAITDMHRQYPASFVVPVKQ